MKISKAKIDKIKENILAVLYRSSPKSLFTVDIASELIRDEEFIKRLLLELEKAKFVVRVTKNPEGIDYIRRIRWRLSSKVYEAYQKLESQKINYNSREHTYA
jgi:hypothetical protein